MSTLAAINTLPRPMTLRDRMAMFDVGLMVTGGPCLLTGLFFAAIFAAGADLDQSEFSEHDPVVIGAVTHIQAPGKTKSGRGTYRFDYLYEAGGKRYKNSSWSDDPDVDLDSDSIQVNVQYLAGRPERSRIVGMDSAPLPSWMWLVGVPCIVLGLPVVIIAFSRARRATRLVRYGIVTRAGSSRRLRAGKGKGGKPLHDVVLHFDAVDGKRYEVELGVVGNFQNGESTRVVYPRDQPEKAERYDDLPKRVKSLIMQGNR